jgi:hypothetical protein
VKRFNRFELKYIVTATQAEAVKEDLLAHMDPDSHSSADGSYSICSIYYDTADLAFMRAKIEGIKFRRKLRVRRYGAGSDGPVFVEIKQRINRTTQKRRLILSLAQAYELCAGGWDRELDDPEDQAAAQEVMFLSQGLNLQPTSVVGYRRQAYVGNSYEPGLRVTFDHDLWGAVASQGLVPDLTRHALLTQSTVIMEVKANNAVPLWLANLLARHNCSLRRYSKYCAATQRLIDLQLLGGYQTELSEEIPDNG